jgi:ATP-dependent DNA ligase
MEATQEEALPVGGSWQYEPKWDGFRCLAFDLPLAERRARLEEFAAKHLAGRDAFHLTPATRSLAQAKRWLGGGRGVLDGVIGKRLDMPYRAGLRDGMVKVKTRRTADCVIGGFRHGRGTRTVASLLLGLYDEDGKLHHVGFTSTIPRDERRAWTRELAAIEEPPGFTGSAPGGPSRWDALKPPQPWHPVRPQIVVEVAYDHWSESRFRHGTSLLRRRPDKDPRQCTFDQVRTAARGTRSPWGRGNGA